MCPDLRINYMAPLSSLRGHLGVWNLTANQSAGVLRLTWCRWVQPGHCRRLCTWLRSWPETPGQPSLEGGRTSSCPSSDRRSELQGSAGPAGEPENNNTLRTTLLYLYVYILYISTITSGFWQIFSVVYCDDDDDDDVWLPCRSLCWLLLHIWCWNSPSDRNKHNKVVNLL